MMLRQSYGSPAHSLPRPEGSQPPAQSCLHTAVLGMWAPAEPGAALYGVMELPAQGSAVTSLRDSAL